MDVFRPGATKTLLRGVAAVKVAGSARDRGTLREDVLSMKGKGKAGKRSTAKPVHRECILLI